MEWSHAVVALPPCKCRRCLPSGDSLCFFGECLSWFLSSGLSGLLSPGSPHSCGNIILFHSSLSLVNSWCDDDDGRFLQCEFSYHGKSFRVCCIYCLNCNPARDQFLDDLHPKIDHFPGR